MTEFFRQFLLPDNGEAGAQSAPAETTPPAETAAPATDTAPATETPPAQSAAELPKYFSQFSPEKRESEDYGKYIKDKATLGDLADAYIDLAKRAERQIEVPGADATPEQKAAFLNRLGVPQKAEEYDCFENEESKRLLSGQFHKLGLTKGQAKGVNSLITSLAAVGNKMSDDAAKARVASFDSRLDGVLSKTYPNEAERKEAAKETVALLQRYVERTGLGKTLKDSGLLYDEAFVMAIAADERSRGGAATFVQSAQPSPQKPGTFGNYSDEFEKKYGGNR